MRSRWRLPTWNEGFTLLEVLLAIVIGAIVLTVLYGSFFQIIKAKDSAENAMELYHEASVIFSRMTKDFQGAYLRGKVYSESGKTTYPSFIGRKEGDRSHIHLVSLSREPGINTKSSDQAEISYYLEPIPDSDLYLLMRRENPQIGSESGGTQYPISERVVAFNLAYVSDDAEGLIEVWDSKQTGALPKAVEVGLILRSATGEDFMFSSLIPIPTAN